MSVFCSSNTTQHVRQGEHVRTNSLAIGILNLLSVAAAFQMSLHGHSDINCASKLRIKPILRRLKLGMCRDRGAWWDATLAWTKQTPRHACRGFRNLWRDPSGSGRMKWIIEMAATSCQTFLVLVVLETYGIGLISILQVLGEIHIFMNAKLLVDQVAP